MSDGAEELDTAPLDGVLEPARAMVDDSSSCLPLRRRKLNVLVAASGSVSVVKVPELVTSLVSSTPGNTRGDRFDVKVVLSKAALHFWKRSKGYNENAWKSFERLIGEKAVFLDEDEWVNFCNKITFLLIPYLYLFYYQSLS